MMPDLLHNLRVLPGERGRFTILALLLFANATILESNEVLATSGFVARVGIEGIPWVWAADMVVVILTSGGYSLVVDRTRRGRLGMQLFAAFGVVYIVLYALFLLGAPNWLSYSLLTVLNDQQWILLPMLIWALANDLFSTAEAKRLFPLLAMAAFAGGVFGNGLTAAVARLSAEGERGSIGLLLLSAGLLLLMASALAIAVRHLRPTAHRARRDEKVLDTFREGTDFVRQVPAYRYLALAMVLLAIGLNVVEYQLIVTAAGAYTSTSSLEAFYATVRAARIGLMVLAQALAAGWLLKRLGFRTIFGLMPVSLLAGLLLAFLCPTLIGVVVGECLVRTTLQGVDEPSRRAFVGLVPDERRGRVGALMDGYLYPLGSFASCLLVGVTLIAVGHRMISQDAGRALYFSIAGLCAGVALWYLARFRTTFDASMLNWRLKRRRRESSLSMPEL